MIYKFAIVFSIVFIIIIIKLVRKDALDEKYSILWLFTGCIILLVSIFPGIIAKVSEYFNVFYPPALLFLFAIIVLGTCLIHVSAVITKQNKTIIRLNQEIAILKEKKQENNHKEGKNND